MAEKVYLHIGTPKAGTTYLQGLLWGNQQRLRDHGVLLAGRRPFQHDLASVAVGTGWTAPRATRVWKQLVEEINAWPGTGLLSNEWFGTAGPLKAANALEAFGDAEVHVVVTARDLTAVIPAAWQESLKRGAGGSLTTMIDDLERPRKRWGYWSLDPAWVLRRWGKELPAERVHVVTVPTSRSNPTLLWERFGGLLDLPDGAVDHELGVKSNESLGVESARLLQLIGPRLRDAVGSDEDDPQRRSAEYRWLRRYLSHQLLAPRGGNKIGLTAEQHRMLHERSAEAADKIAERGYHVAGDLRDLTSGRHDPSRTRPEDVSDAAVTDVAATLVVDLLRELRTTSDEGRPVPDIAEFDQVLRES